MSQKVKILCLLVLLGWVAVPVYAQEKALNRIVSERLIAEVDNLVIKQDVPVFRISPDGKRVAYVAKGTAGNEIVVVDGKKQREYTEVEIPIFSPDSKRLAYVANTGSKKVVILDGEEQRPYDVVVCLVFSPDSKRLAYIAKRDERCYVVVDGKEGTYDPITFDPAFSADSQHLAYVATEGKQWFMVVDGREIKRYNEPALVVLPRWSPDGQRLAYVVAVPRGKCFAVIDGEEGKKYEGIVAGPWFSPDSKHAAYTAISVQQKKKWFVVVDGREQGPFDVVGTFSFSPDGKHLAYAAERDGVPWVVVDGKQQYRGGFIPPVFSPDSKRIAYGHGQALLVHGGVVHMQQWVAVDGLEQKHYQSVTKGSLTFSPDSSHLAYIAVDEKGQFVVVDGKEGKRYDKIVEATLMFSPDSQHVAYMAAMGSKQFVVIDEKEGNRYEANSILGGTKIVFDSPDDLHYLAVKENSIYLVEEVIQ